MAERYFPGFDFIRFEPSKLKEITEVLHDGDDLSDYSVESFTLEESGDFPPIHEVEPELSVWKVDDLQVRFVSLLRSIDKQINHPRLTMSRMTMRFVSRDEMRPKTEEEKQMLIQRYGDYIVDGGVGDCTRNPNGTYSLRIGYAGCENSASLDEVLSVMGHEYGHTVGEQIEDPVLEELKAYAFANLVMRVFYGVRDYRVYQMDVSNVHETALFWLEQLLDRGVSEEEILAHLTMRRFGKSYPYDYLYSLNPKAQSKLKGKH